VNKLKSHFRFNKQERSGIFFLLLIIVALQIGYYFFGNFSKGGLEDVLVTDHELQAHIDTLKQAALKKDSVIIYPFNPNFISDYKGYTLGMSTDEIDRLHAFRKKNKFVNSPKEFQQLTHVSDSLLGIISPYFKFPEWTKKKKRPAGGSTQFEYASSSNKRTSEGNPNGRQREGRIANDESFPPDRIGQNNDRSSQTAPITDLNTVTAEELRTINGIGELSYSPHPQHYVGRAHRYRIIEKPRYPFDRRLPYGWNIFFPGKDRI